MTGYEIQTEQFPNVVEYVKQMYAMPAYAHVIEKENELEFIQDIKRQFSSTFKIIE